MARKRKKRVLMGYKANGFNPAAHIIYPDGLIESPKRLAHIRGGKKIEFKESKTSYTFKVKDGEVFVTHYDCHSQIYSVYRLKEEDKFHSFLKECHDISYRLIFTRDSLRMTKICEFVPMIKWVYV